MTLLHVHVFQRMDWCYVFKITATNNRYGMGLIDRWWVWTSAMVPLRNNTEQVVHTPLLCVFEVRTAWHYKMCVFKVLTLSVAYIIYDIYLSKEGHHFWKYGSRCPYLWWPFVKELMYWLTSSVWLMVLFTCTQNWICSRWTYAGSWVYMGPFISRST